MKEVDIIIRIPGAKEIDETKSASSALLKQRAVLRKILPPIIGIHLDNCAKFIVLKFCFKGFHSAGHPLNSKTVGQNRIIQKIWTKWSINNLTWEILTRLECTVVLQPFDCNGFHYVTDQPKIQLQRVQDLEQ